MGLTKRDSMLMYFHQTFADPLFAEAWIPRNQAEYFGTVVFIILLGMLWRGSIGGKMMIERKWARQEASRQVLIARTPSEESLEKLPQKIPRGKSFQMGTPPWRWSEDFPRAFLVFVIQGLGYLLMLVVMTFNIGYFFAVLVGIFLGELTFGRFSRRTAY